MVCGEELGARSQILKEFSLFKKQFAQWLERDLGVMSEGEHGQAGQALKGHCREFRFGSKCGGTTFISESLSGKGEGEKE